MVDLDFWYGNGPGNPASSAQGIGYVQELVSRLTKTPISTFDSAVNKSIVTNPTLFPLDQPIFVDATHDSVISMSMFCTIPYLNYTDIHWVPVLVAMNFTTLAATGPLPTDHIPNNRVSQLQYIHTPKLIGLVVVVELQHCQDCAVRSQPCRPGTLMPCLRRADAHPMDPEWRRSALDWSTRL